MAKRPPGEVSINGMHFGKIAICDRLKLVCRLATVQSGSGEVEHFPFTTSTMSGHESATESIRVWCLLIDHQTRRLGNSFLVMVSLEDLVEKIMAKIKAQSCHLASIDSNELCVWKLHKPHSLKDVICTDFLMIVKLLYELPEDEDKDKTDQFLDPADQFSLNGLWPENMIHLLV
jgi:hypothetical protein